MMRASLLIFGLVASGYAAKFEVESTDGDVLVLDEVNFDSTIAEHQAGILVEFFAPWCGHCKKLAPEYKRAATKLMEETDGKARLAMIDATEEKELAQRYGVKGFPTLKLFKGGNTDKWTEYEGGRTEREIVAYMKKKTGSVARLVVDGDDFRRTLGAAAGAGTGGVLVCGFFSDLDGAAAQLFFRAADDSLVSDLEFVYSPDTSLAELHPALAKPGSDATQPPVVGDAVVVFKDFDERQTWTTVQPAVVSVEELVRFVVAESTPRLLDFSPERTKAIFRGPVKVHMLTFYEAKAPYEMNLRATLTSLADIHRGRVLHVFVPATEEKVMSYFGVEKKELPRTVLADMSVEGNMKKYHFAPTGAASKAHELGDLRAFEESFLAGDLKPNLKSEEDSPGHMRGKVKVLTGETFKDNVMGSGRDVLVMFHAPWCGHCKALSPKWDELGELFSDSDEHVYIAKMDATANEIDVEGVAVKGFPTIYYFPASGKPVVYDGGREVSDFTAYLAVHSTKPFILKDKDEL